jgi:two-component system sensor histidine kinase BaeS
MKYIRDHLGAKLLLSYMAVILIGVVVLLIAVSIAAPFAYNHYVINMDSQGMATGMMGQGGPQPGRGLGYSNFRAGMLEALFYAALISAVVAICVSLIFSRKVVSPLRAMMDASQRIAEGHFSERVQVNGTDELAQLAERFNDMGGQLEQVETRRRQLIGDVSHELRTPLTAIKGSMEGLIDGILPATPTTFEQIQREAERLTRLVDDLQELSRVEAKAYHLEICPISISTLVESAASRFDLQLKQKGIALTLDLPADLPRVLADEDRIGQVLTNLLSNAWQYTPSGGQIFIIAEVKREEVYISVKDTGVGISQEHLAHVFDRFFRIDKSRSRITGGGSGIGLTVAKYLVEAHGGRIWVESVGVGNGSVFIFTLPVEK